jgi:hypothetical protein
MRLDPAMNLLAVLVILIVQGFALFIALLQGSESSLYRIMPINFVYCFFWLGVLFFYRPQLDLRARMLPVTVMEWVVSRFTLRFLLFGWPYIVVIPVLLIFAPHMLESMMAKFVIAGVVISFYLSAHILLFSDIAISLSRQKILKTLSVIIATGPIVFVYILVAFEQKFLFALWDNYISMQAGAPFYLVIVALLLLSTTYIWLDKAIVTSKDWYSGVLTFSKGIKKS